MFLIASDETQILLGDVKANSSINLHLPLMFSNIKVIDREASKGIKMQMNGGRLAPRRWPGPFSRVRPAFPAPQQPVHRFEGKHPGSPLRRSSDLGCEHIRGRKSQSITTETATLKSSSLFCVQEKKSSAHKLQWPKLLIISVKIRPLCAATTVLFHVDEK